MPLRNSIGRRKALALCSGIAGAVGLTGFTRNRSSATEKQQPSFGVSHEAIGDAELQKTEDGLVVALEEQGAEGGVRARMRGTKGYVANWATIDEQAVGEEATMTLSANGRVSQRGTGGQGELRPLGSTRVRRRGSEFSIEVNYEPIESSAQFLAVFDGGDRVEMIEEHPGELKAIVTEPPGGCGKGPTLPPIPPIPPVCYIWNWNETVPIEIEGVGTVEGDEFRILAADSPLGLDSLNQFDVRFGGISSINIQSESLRYGSA